MQSASSMPLAATDQSDISSRSSNDAIPTADAPANNATATFGTTYIDEIVEKYDLHKLYTGHDGVHTVDSLRADAYTLEHPAPVHPFLGDLIAFLNHTKDAYKAATQIDNENVAFSGMPMKYGMAFTEDHVQYGYSGSRRGCGPPKLSNREILLIRDNRARFANSPEFFDGVARTPKSVKFPPGQCAEQYTIPRMFKLAMQAGKDLVITSATVDIDKKPARFCPSCIEYAKALVEANIGLVIIDSYANTRYESEATRKRRLAFDTRDASTNTACTSVIGA